MIEKNNLEFTRIWANQLLDNMSETGAGKRFVNGEKAIEACSAYCFREKNMAEMFKDVTTLEELIEIFRTKWNWVVDYDKEHGVLICNENKDYCLCPIEHCSKGDVSKNLCLCTRGMIKSIFRFALQKEVNVELLRSVIRDGKSCIYKIIL